MCSQSAISEFHQAMPGSSASYANAEAACSGGGMQIHPRSGTETSILPATWGEFCGVMVTDLICKLHFRGA